MPFLTPLGPIPAEAEEPAAKTLFGAAAAPARVAPAPIGRYAAGCLAGAVALPATGPGWTAMRPSRNRAWGHPAAIAFIARLGGYARAVGWGGVHIGDMSQPRGGPMRTGHASHQTGLDIDVWLRPALRLDLGPDERETLASIDVRSPDQRAVTGAWSPAHQALLRAVAEDASVARIFLTPPAKQAMCDALAPPDRAWLRKVRPWWGHNTHFHVRLACPPGAAACEEQDPIPMGDGCDESLAWWMSDAALIPDPDKVAPPPKPDLTLADLPGACRAVLMAP